MNTLTHITASSSSHVEAVDTASDALHDLTLTGRQLLQPGLSAKQLGIRGEDYAAVWLSSRGWRIVDRNWRSRYGELDIIVLNTERELVFVEVKTRRCTIYGTPQEAVGHHKRLTLRRAGVQWLQEKGRDISHVGTRFDVLAITVSGNGRMPHVTHIPGAL